MENILTHFGPWIYGYGEKMQEQRYVCENNKCVVVHDLVYFPKILKCVLLALPVFVK
jgi:hypothetical protein